MDSPSQFRTEFMLESQVRNAMNSLPVMLVHCDLHGLVVWAIGAGIKQGDRREIAQQGRRLTDFFKDQPIFTQLLEPKTQKTMVQFEFQWQGMTLFLTSAPQYKNQELSGNLILILDTGQQNAEPVPTFPEQHLSLAITEALQEGLTINNAQHEFEYVNPSFAKMLGYSQAELIGKHPYDFLNQYDKILLDQQHQRRLVGESSTFVVQMEHRLGHQVDVKVHGYPRFDTVGNFSGTIASVRDISQEVEQQKRLTWFEAELETLSMKFIRQEAFNGQLAEIGGAAALLQMLVITQPTGCLEISNAKVFIDQGNIVAVEHPSLKHEQAVIVLLQLEQGRFYFYPDQKPALETMSLPVLSLVLQLWREKDAEHLLGERILVRQKVIPQTRGLILLPNATAANAFMAGVGGKDAFAVGKEYVTEVKAECVVLLGRGFRVVVLNASEDDFRAE